LIAQIKITGFKSLADVDLTLGSFNLFIGANTSGKSNFFDALRVLQGIGYSFTIDEILNGKPKSAGSEVWEPIRGGSAMAYFIGITGNDAGTDAKPQIFGLEIALKLSSLSQKINYSVGIDVQIGRVGREELSLGNRTIFKGHKTFEPGWGSFLSAQYDGDGIDSKPHLRFESSRSLLHQLLRHNVCNENDRKLIESCIHALSNMQRIDPTSAISRDYSQTQIVKRLGERGENFATLLKGIASDEKLRSAYLSWLSELTPSEVEDITILQGALGESLFAIKERGNIYPAPILSDGTLRFAAITAAFFQAGMPDILTIEEIENGIHPSRLRLLLELLKSQSSLNRQVIATTHSPVALAWLEEKDYATTFFCKRDEQTGASVIKPLNEVPRFLELVHKQPLGDLFTEGWLEEAL